MDRDTVIALAREAGLEILNFDGEDEVGCGDGYHIQTDLIERFAALVAAHEREECAKVCDEEANDLSISEHWSDCGEYIANRIRSRT